jgi:hypothetical protein
MVEPLQSINRAIEAKDRMSFVEAFNGFTIACNSCHREMGREFITIQVPTVSPFSDQSFAQSKKE